MESYWKYFDLPGTLTFMAMLFLISVSGNADTKLGGIGKESGCPAICRITEENKRCHEIPELQRNERIQTLPEICNTFLSDKFVNAKECEEECIGCNLDNVIEDCSLRKFEEKFAICKLPPDVGPCDGMFMRWYFNPQRGRCQKFTYGGCRGNENNFETDIGCHFRCGFLAILEPRVLTRQTKTRQEL